MRRACPANTNVVEGPSKVMHQSVHKKMQDGTYRPWIVVAYRKNGTKSHGSGGVHSVLDNGRLRQELRKNVNEARISSATRKLKVNNGPAREAKRKLTPPKCINEAHFANAIQSIGSAFTYVA